VILRASFRSRRAGGDQSSVMPFLSQVRPYRSVKSKEWCRGRRSGTDTSGSVFAAVPEPLNKGISGLMGTVRMPDHDRLDRMERKLNRIGKYVLFGIALFTVLLAVEMQKLSSDVFFGYGRLAVWSFIGVMIVMLLVARAPFRD
jgi:hypothetical protein